MNRLLFRSAVCLLAMALIGAAFSHTSRTSLAQQSFAWPEGQRGALSLTFDDSRLSQIDIGMEALAKLNTKATFYVQPSSVEKRLEGWKKMIAAGHEIANHTIVHPCSGNFPWARQKALEEYSLQKMNDELVEANERIKALLGVTPVSYAYTCGQTFVGRGLDARSYIPVVASLFLTGRSAYDETPNDPLFCDFAQLASFDMDAKTFDQLLPMLEQTKKQGGWLILMGHEMNSTGAPQTTRLDTLEKLVAYAKAPENKLWNAPVVTIAKYVQQQRKK
ncbi:MAG TPA: polysaccharide deacetylase family protein [Blastocatellia bacterium]|nr:polysaccharide deacetylase family protein [Blastocatellia bacterium]